MRAASFYWNSVDGKVRSEMFPEHPIMFEQIESKQASLDGVNAQSRTLKESNSYQTRSFFFFWEQSARYFGCQKGVYRFFRGSVTGSE